MMMMVLMVRKAPPDPERIMFKKRKLTNTKNTCVWKEFGKKSVLQRSLSLGGHHHLNDDDTDDVDDRVPVIEEKALPESALDIIVNALKVKT